MMMMNNDCDSSIIKRQSDWECTIGKYDDIIDRPEFKFDKWELLLRAYSPTIIFVCLFP